MKNLLLAVAFYFLMSFAANAQMQTKFWELEIGKSYSSINEAASLIEDRCTSYRINSNALEVRQGRFGGYDWDFIDFTFAGRVEKKLYKVEFVNCYKTKGVAVDMATPLYQSLKNKYGMPEKTGTIEYRWSFQNDAHVCLLKVIESEGQGGGVYWYVVLTYCDLNSSRQVSNNEESEL